MATRERVLITVKTYPTLSRKYGETVCTAGVRPDGTWMRIYPVPFRRLEEEEQYRKFDWIETEFVRGTSDPRPETRHPADMAKMVPAGHIGTDDNWRERRELLLKTAKVYDRLEPLMTGAKENQLSLAVFKPTKIRDSSGRMTSGSGMRVKWRKCGRSRSRSRCLQKIPGGRHSS